MPIKVFATDIDRSALRIASAGVFPESIAADVPRELLERYFQHNDGFYKIRESIRKLVIFSYHNVLKDPPFNRMDLISCRNFLIYLQSPAQQQVLSLFAFSLPPKSILFLGPSETIGDMTSYFQNLHHRWKLHSRREGSRSLNIHGPLFNINEAREKEEEVLPKERPAQLERQIFKMVMSRLSPPCLIVDDSHQVLMAFGPINKYLNFPVGRMSYDLSNLISNQLSILLSTALHRARTEKKRILYQNVNFSETSDESPQHSIDVIVDPFPSELSLRQVYGIVFRESGVEVKSESSKTLQLRPDQHTMDLQKELQYTKENLQATIEELETANEELQATNEELLSSNEELQSTNEELQSVNEELITVNAEYQKKIEELTELNSDLHNFFLSSNTGMLFLDKDLLIRKFSPLVAQNFNLLPSDEGRNIMHFSSDFDYPELFEDTQYVLHRLEPKEREVMNKNGRWYQTRILPYRTQENRIRGVIITFVDITEKRNYTQHLYQARQKLSMLENDNKPEALERRILLIEDDELQAKFIQKKLKQISPKSHIHTSHDGQSALSHLKHQLTQELSTDLIFLDLELPNMHGFDVLKTIKNTPVLCRIPVVILSSTDDASEVRKAYELQANGFIAKPGLSDQLRSVLHHVHDYWFTVAQKPAKEQQEGI